MVAILQAIISGLAIGGIYALIAQGYYITQITTNKLNFGQGDFLMLGGLIGLSLVNMNLPIWVAIVGAMLALFLVGWLSERIGIQTMKTGVAVAWIMSTVAISMISRDLMMILWGRNEQRLPSPFGIEQLRMGGVGIQYHEIFVLAVSIVTTLLLILFLKRSKLGKALRAVAFNPDAASLMGISPKFMSGFAFALSAALAALGGMLVGPITFVGAFKGGLLGLKAFAAAMLGGLEEPMGIFWGGLLLGLAEMLANTLIGPEWKDIAPFLLIIVVLAISPTGLFASRAQEKV